VVGSSSTSRSGSATRATAKPHALLLPAGQLAHPAPGERPDSGPVDDLGDGARPLRQRGGEPDRLRGGQVRQQAAGLQQGADAALGHRPGGRHAVQEGGARVGSDQTQQHVDGGGLAGTVRAEQRHHLAAPDAQVQPVDGGHLAVPLDETGQPDRIAVLVRHA
jgi:hypothetical protein